MGNQECCCDDKKTGEFKLLKKENYKITTLDGQKSPTPQSYIKNLKIENQQDTKKNGEIQEAKNVSIIIRNEGSPPSSILSHSFLSKQKDQDRQNTMLQISKRLTTKKKLQDSESQKEMIIQNSIKAPDLNEKVKSVIGIHEFFKDQLNFEPSYKQYAGEIYEGQLDENSKIPEGYGKFYKKDGSLYIGEFVKGKAHGNGVYIFPDGSYYKGEFFSNEADSENGFYFSDELTYQGEFKNNTFHGKGKENSSTHEFEGSYQKGKKVSGILKWAINDKKYSYDGQFDENGDFKAKGKLTEPTGIYEGEFENGQKHGQGIYKYTNGLRYEGMYAFGQRQGKGKIFNPSNKVAYQGDFSKGLPHGEGIIIDSNGTSHSASWIMGIDSELV